MAKPSDHVFLTRVHSYLKELYDSRSILRSLVYKGFFGKYKNSYLGVMWQFATPLFMILMYYIVFSEIRTNSAPNYWLYISSAVIPFSFLQTNLASGATAIVGNSAMLKKIYFPRELVIIALIINSFIVYFIAYVIMFIVALICGINISGTMVVGTVFITLLMVLFSTGLTLFLSAIVVYLRDIQHIITSTMMCLYWMTPIFYDLNTVSGVLSKIVHLNPYAYYVQSFKDLIYYGITPAMDQIGVCVLLGLSSIAIGEIVFLRLKNKFVERL